MEMQSHMAAAQLMLANVYMRHMRQEKWKAALEKLDEYLEQHPMAPGGDQIKSDESRAAAERNLWCLSYICHSPGLLLAFTASCSHSLRICIACRCCRPARSHTSCCYRNLESEVRSPHPPLLWKPKIHRCCREPDLFP